MRISAFVFADQKKQCLAGPVGVVVSVLAFTTMIRIRIQLTPTIFSVKFAIENNENKQKRGQVWAHF